MIPSQNIITAERIGGTTDLAAGQLIDRCGNLLGLSFPSGPALETLALSSISKEYYLPRADGINFSISGIENKIKDKLASGTSAEDIAAFTIRSVCELLCRALKAAVQIYPGIPILCVGGVMSNSIIRREIETRFGAVFAKPEFSSDNAAGIALLAALAHKGSGGYQ